MPTHQKDPIVISIARDYGAEGHEVGKLLSDRLGIPLYDNELLVRLAIRTGFDVDQVAKFDEHSHGGPLGFLPDIMENKGSSDAFFKAIKQIILDLGNTQSCIIEGRLSDYILRDNPNLIRVLVTAPADKRVEIVAAKRGLSAREGRALVKRMQKEREYFYKHYSNGKWTMHTAKDLVVDRSVYGVEGCCEIIAAAYEYKKRQLDAASTDA